MESLSEAAETRFIPTEGINAYHGASVFLAVIAYPERSEWPKRKEFVTAARAFGLKDYIAHGGNRKMILPKFRRLKNEKIAGILSKAVRRMAARLSAASMAMCMILDGAKIPFEESLPGKPVGVVLRGPNSVFKAANALLRDREAHQGVYLEPHSGAANILHRRWVSSLPVLHLALALPVHKFAVATLKQAGASGALRELSVELALLWIYKPDWLGQALAYAEKMRHMLPVRIPPFRLENAISLLPTEDLTQAYLLPAKKL
jgi:hypothetical protein